MFGYISVLCALLVVSQNNEDFFVRSVPRVRVPILGLRDPRAHLRRKVKTPRPTPCPEEPVQDFSPQA